MSVFGVFWSVFLFIRTEYGEILCISSYSVRMRENTDQKNSEYGHFSCSALVSLMIKFDLDCKRNRFVEFGREMENIG